MFVVIGGGARLRAAAGAAASRENSWPKLVSSGPAISGAARKSDKEIVRSAFINIPI